MRLNDDRKKALANAIKTRRKYFGLSQKQLGDFCENITKQMISKFENEQCNTISEKLLKNLSKNLSCTPDYLLGLSAEPSLCSNGLINPVEFLPGVPLKNRIYTASNSDLEIYSILFDVLEKNQDEEKRKILKSILKAFL